MGGTSCRPLESASTLHLLCYNYFSMAKPYLSVIIPDSRKLEQLPLTLVDVDKRLFNQEYSYEIIVVNDGNAPKVGELIKNLKAASFSQDNLSSMIQLANGIAKGNWRLIFDPQNQVPVSEFNKIASRGANEYEVFIGVPRSGNFICLSEAAAQQILPLAKSSRWILNYEIEKIASGLGYKIKKMPVIYSRKTSRFSSPKELWFDLGELIKVYWRLRRGKSMFNKKISSNHPQV